jgi:large subunit ribosomal protein L18
MKNLDKKLFHQILRAKRTRSKIHGTQEVPRLSVHISLRHVSAQLIDDDKRTTLVYVTSVGNKKLNSNLTAIAQQIGSSLAEKAIKKKITKVVFDRGYKNYHGRVKALAEAARSKGLEF